MAQRTVPPKIVEVTQLAVLRAEVPGAEEGAVACTR